MTEKHHDLKTWKPYFEEVLAMRKTFEVRKNDRDYGVGDLLHLYEWDHIREAYTGRMIPKRVLYVLHGGDFGIEQGFVVLSLGYTATSSTAQREPQ